MIRLKIYKIRNSGFTLVELLITVFIISSMFAFGYANYRQYSQRQAHIALARQIEGDLILARNYANSGKKTASCSTSTLNGYEFVWDGVATYSIYAVCDGSPTGDAVISHTIDTTNYKLDTCSSGDFMFKTLGNGTDLSSDCTITLRQEALGRDLHINVSKSGGITISE